MTRPWTSGPSAVSALALSYLMFLPFGQLFVVPVGGAMGSLTDLVLVMLVLGAVLAKLAGLGSPADGTEAEPGVRSRANGIAVGLLLTFGVWVGTSSMWSFHSTYAGTKGAGVVLLVVGAWALAASRVSAPTLADGWLVGAAVAVALSLLVVAVGPAPLRERVLYRVGSVDGLPFSRFRGTFLHPNLLGDYLAVTVLLLWARWPSWRSGAVLRGGTWMAPALVGLFALASLLTMSSGWLTLGGGLVALAVAAPGWRRGGRWATGLAGAALVVPTAVGLLGALEFSAGSLVIRTGGIRPAIWSDAAMAVLESPLLGVGAAPYLAETVDPGGGGGTALWDAHSTYLSVAGQFGIVGVLLFFGGMAMVVRAVYRAGSLDRSAEADSVAHHRLTVAFLAAAVGLLLHWTSIAGEDSRHLWALVGIGLALGARGRFGTPKRGEPPVR